MFKMSVVCSDVSMEALMPPLHCIVDDMLVLAFPLLRNALLQLIHNPNILNVDSLQELLSLQTADILNICCKFCTTFAVNAEFYCHMFCIKIDRVICACSHDNFQSFRYNVISKE